MSDFVWIDGAVIKPLDRKPGRCLEHRPLWNYQTRLESFIERIREIAGDLEDPAFNPDCWHEGISDEPIFGCVVGERDLTDEELAQIHNTKQETERRERAELDRLLAKYPEAAGSVAAAEE